MSGLFQALGVHVHYRIGSLEKTKAFYMSELQVHYRIGSLERSIFK